MKDGKFETQAEIYQALLQNKRLRTDSFMAGEYVEMRDGLQVNKHGSQSYQSFSSPQDWSIYQEPKTPEKVKIVAHMHEDGNIYYSEENSRRCASLDCSDIFKRLSISFDAEVMV